jgi:hypothetical protein
MSEHEALARFHYGCAARHHKVEIRRLWRSRCMMHAQRSPLTNVLIRSANRQLRAIAIAGIGLVLSPGEHEHRPLDLAGGFRGQPIGSCERDGTDVLTRERQPHDGRSPGPLAHQVKAIDAQRRQRGAAAARRLLRRRCIRRHREYDDAPALGRQCMSARGLLQVRPDRHGDEVEMTGVEECRGASVARSGGRLAPGVAAGKTPLLSSCVRPRFVPFHRRAASPRNR